LCQNFKIIVKLRTASFLLSSSAKKLRFKKIKLIIGAVFVVESDHDLLKISK
jgi:hypothetical protein